MRSSQSDRGYIDKETMIITLEKANRKLGFIIHQSISAKLSIYLQYEQCFLPGQGFTARKHNIDL